jgi:hypothetical protein
VQRGGQARRRGVRRLARTLSVVVGVDQAERVLERRIRHRLADGLEGVLELLLVQEAVAVVIKVLEDPLHLVERLVLHRRHLRAAVARMKTRASALRKKRGVRGWRAPRAAGSSQCARAGCPTP